MSGATPVELASRDWRDWRAGVTLTSSGITWVADVAVGGWGADVAGVLTWLGC